MTLSDTTAPEPKNIALVAHDDRKSDLLEWAEYNRDILADHTLYATGTTGRLLGKVSADYLITSPLLGESTPVHVSDAASRTEAGPRGPLTGSRA